MGAREHFWELRREVEINAIKNNQNQLKKRKFLRRVWIPLRKISVNNMFLSFNNEFDLKRTWQIFKEYKFYKERRDEVSFVLEGVEKALEEEITSFKEMEEMESDVSGAKEKILEKIKKGIKRKKGEIIRKYYYGYEDSIKSKRLFLFLGIRRVGESFEVNYFVGTTKKQRIKTGTRMFHRVPEKAVGFSLVFDENGRLVPHYTFGF